MSDRDELADLIKPAAAHDYWPQKAAELVLAAGYRKQQQVTTVEELDALANGSVVLDADRATATRLDADYWEVAGYASHFRIDAITLPATVLHVGGAA